MTTPTRGGSVLGTRVLRTEDPAFLTGTRRYLADLELPDRLHAVFVRSDIAHGVITRIHLDDALGMPGVVAILTNDEIGVAPHHSLVEVHPDFARPPLADGRVRFVGEPFAVVLAETNTEGADAANAVWAEIEPLPASVDAETSLSIGATLIFPDHGSNVALSIEDDVTTDFTDADVVVRGRYVNQRMAVAPMEPNGCAARVDDDGRLTFWASTQAPHGLRRELARALDMDPGGVHVVTPAVGGGFGGKAGLYSEFSVVAAAARRIGRPVIWTPTRSEDMKSLAHSRGQIQYAELGCTAEGRFTALKVRLIGDAGAYPGVGSYLPGGTRRMANGTYAFPSIEFDVAVAVTNTTPMGAYRGAGRPEATAMLERLVDQAALELGLDPIEIRRRNLLTEEVFPFLTLTGHTYDVGRYLAALERAAEIVGYDALRVEQAHRRSNDDHTEDHTLLGIGVATYVEITAGAGGGEFGSVEVHADGSATVYAGTQSHGQGHQTAYAMLVSDQTGIPVDRIVLVDGDTDLVRTGGGTSGSRSLQVGGSAVHGATAAMIAKARQLAARILEADADDIVIDTATGTIGVAGVPSRALSWSELASRSEEYDVALSGDCDFLQDGATFPFGAHIAVVEVDTETGRVDLVRHVAVDDCGTVIAPMLVLGQQHGGIAAGVGQALFEQVVYDDDGNPVTSNLADYCIAAASDLPSFEAHSIETPTPLNPLGAKGIGEAATIGSTPAVQNAVVDALAHLGVRHIDLPCTPERVWTALRDARDGTLRDPWREPPDVFARRPHDHEDPDAATVADGI